MNCPIFMKAISDCQDILLAACDEMVSSGECSNDSIRVTALEKMSDMLGIVEFLVSEQ